MKVCLIKLNKLNLLTITISFHTLQPSHIKIFFQKAIQVYWFLKIKNSSYKNNAWDFPGGSVVKNPPANAGDTGSSPGPGRFPHAAEQLSLCATTTEPVL